MPYWNFEYTKVYTMVKVRGGMGQDSATKTQATRRSSAAKDPKSVFILQALVVAIAKLFINTVNHIH